MGEPFNWLFKEERLRRTPSIKIGISHGQELFFRQKQAMLMQTIGQKSGLTPLAINTSVIFMHRFYMYRTIKFFPRIHVAIGFVFAAGKVEESARKLEHLIRFTVDVLRNNKNGEFLDKRDKLTYEMDCEWREKIETLCQNNCDVSSVAYEEMRKTVLECETEIYAVIGFQLQITHPHKFVIRMSSQLGAENRPAIYRAIKDAEKQISGSRRCVDGSGVSPPSNTNGNGLNGHSNPSGTDDLQAVSKKTSQVGNGKTNGHNNADRQNGNGEHLKGINGNSMQIDSQNRPNETHSTDDSSNDSTGVPRMEIATTHIAGSVYIADNIKDISQYAYNLATVSTQLTLLNLKYKPETIATVCLNIASKAHSVKFMSNKDTNKYWYRVCDPAAEFKEIEAVSEEFLALIKACPLLPSWMTNLSRGPTRAVARQPGHPHRPVAPSGNHHPPSSSRQPPPRPPTSQPAAATSSSDTTSSGSHSQQPASSTTTSSSSSSIPHSEAGSATSTSSSSHPAVPSSTSSSSHHSQHHPDSNRQQQQQLAPSGASSSANRPPSSTVPGASGSSSSSGSNRHHPQHQHHHQQQQLHHQRSHPSAPPSSRGGHHKSQQPPVPGSRPQQPPSSSSSSRPQPPSTGHAAPPNPSSSSSLQYPPRPDYPRRPEGTAPQERRPPSQYPIEDVNRHHSQQQRQQQPSVNQNLSSHLTEIPRSTPPVPQAQQPPPQQQQTSMVSNPTTPPEPYPGSLANDTPDFLASPSDSNHGSQSLSAAAAAAAGVGPKLSLSSYRERLGTRIRPGQSSSSQNDSLNTDDSGIHTAASEENCSSLDTNTLSVDSPNNSNVSTPDLGSSFSVPQDSPTNPRLKLKVKRESSLAAGAAGPSAIPGDKQQHNVKYADSGLRIKIKPPKMELLKDEELSGGASRSGTPVEEGEVFDSPSSTGSSDRRSDGSLKMRLTIPKRGETEMNGSGDGVDQSSSGGHRHHHSGHHHRKHHHHHKSKKHKQSSSRHEGKSSKRSGDHNEERPSKASRMDHDSQSSTSTSVYRGPVPMHNQNSGFSINDAFSSTMPNNIFDDEDDSSQSTAPPITPTPDSVPSHHHHRMYRQSSSSRKPPSSSSSLPSMNSMLEDPPHHHHFHQLMAQHRANEAKKPPLPPLPASNQPPPPPPPPPPRSPPPSAF